jgi:hypothetical protein
MDFATTEKYVRQILTLEFDDRDQEIQTNIISVKSEMNARDLVNSTITLTNLSAFFLAEFNARIDLIAGYATGRIDTTTASEGKDKSTQGVHLFRTIAAEQYSHIEKSYDAAAALIIANLQSGMPTEIRQHMLQRMTAHMKKNELAVEFEYKTAEDTGPKEVFILRPTIYGVGVDLKELWNKWFR